VIMILIVDKDNRGYRRISCPLGVSNSLG